MVAEEDSENQADLLNVGKKHDIFSMGIILCTVITGNLPPAFGNGDFAKPSYKRMYPLNKDGSFHRLDQLLQSMLSADRDRRPTAQEALGILESVLSEESRKEIENVKNLVLS